jgi:hypothetical protein
MEKNLMCGRQNNCAKSLGQPLRESDLSQWKLVEDFRRRPDVAAQRVPAARTQSDPRRQLRSADYFCLLLFGLFRRIFVITIWGSCLMRTGADMRDT